MNNVAGKAYNYDFKLLLEGMEVPFKSANIVCTPNGVEFNINVQVNEELFNLKPKTAAQIFFKEWYFPEHAWRMLADGFFSGFVTSEDSTGGRAIGITCRDFRMDIRKSPAAIAWAGNRETPGVAQSQFSINGVYQNIASKKLVTNKKTGEDEAVNIKGRPTRMYDQTGLMDLAVAIERIVGTAYGTSSNSGRYSAFNFSTSEIEDKYGNKKANGGLFLDAFIRGIWMEAVGGTRVNSFMNKRIRADKRFLVPRNYASFNFWKKNNFGLEVGSAIMGNSRFSSLEAAMMNVAGMFSTRVYSCCTPSLISLEKENNPGLEYVMDDTVRRFMEATNKLESFSARYGPMYILNESMLLPPLEFSAPPNCNLFFPPMYDSINWQRDDDSDITRAYYGVIHSLNTTGGTDFGQVKFQIPNDMFGVTAEKVKGTEKRLPLTLEERYKGVNVYHGSVEYNLASADAAKSLALAAIDTPNGKEAYVEMKAEVDDAKKSSETPTPTGQTEGFQAEIETRGKVQDAEKAAKKKEAERKSKIFGDAIATAYKRHAMIKYINMKYSGRVVTISMSLNPFVMCGFPGAIISALEEMGTNVTKTIIGMVQQVTHTIQITPQGAEASTNVIMNNCRFEDEATDLDASGMPLYMDKTDRAAAAVNPSTLEFVQDENEILKKRTNKDGSPKNPYRVPNAVSPVAVDEDSDKYDLKEVEIGPSQYAKDFLSTSNDDLAAGKEERTYVDTSYEPNRVFKFYTQVFKHTYPHFMLGTHESNYFAYNTMHEAFVDLRKRRPELLRDYAACMQFVSRDICSADGFYHGILGLSSFEEGNGYVHRVKDFIDDKIESVYWGISTEDYNNGVTKGLNMTGPGQFSSIREHSPITALIEERRLAVEDYKQAAIETATGVAFNG